MKTLITILILSFSLNVFARVCENEDYIVTFNISEKTLRTGFGDRKDFPVVNQDDEITIFVKADKKLFTYRSLATTNDGFGNNGFQSLGNWSDEYSQFFKPVLEIEWDHETRDLSGFFYGYEESKYGYRTKTKEYSLDKEFVDCKSVHGI